ncbi:unnamed protein product [Brassica oleracea var. botrytis]
MAYIYFAAVIGKGAELKFPTNLLMSDIVAFFNNENFSVNVKQNVGCTASMGPCEKGKSCTTKCKVTIGQIANGYCDRSTCGLGECVCVYPCPPPKTHL